MTPGETNTTHSKAKSLGPWRTHASLLSEEPALGVVGPAPPSPAAWSPSLPSPLAAASALSPLSTGKARLSPTPPERLARTTKRETEVGMCAPPRSATILVPMKP